jgi:hypothetical protein
MSAISAFAKATTDKKRPEVFAPLPVRKVNQNQQRRIVIF